MNIIGIDLGYGYTKAVAMSIPDPDWANARGLHLWNLSNTNGGAPSTT